MIEGEARFPGATPLDSRIDYAKIIRNIDVRNHKP